MMNLHSIRRISIFICSLMFPIISYGGNEFNFILQSYAPGTLYSGMHLVDLDNDGTDEVILGQRYWNSSGNIEIWKYVPTNNMLTKVTSIPVIREPHDLKAADFDGDGRTEIIVAGRGWGPYYVDNTPSGWSPPIALSPQAYSWQIMTEDFDSDGNQDFFQGVDGATVGRLFYGNGSGNFTVGPIPSGWNRGLGFTAIDVNADAQPDLIGMQQYGSYAYLSLYINSGSRSWANRQDVAQVSGVVYPHGAPSAADFDSDGYVDVVALLYDNSTAETELIMFDGEPGPSWTPTVMDILPGQWIAAVVVEVNNDGHPDIAVGGGHLNEDLLLYLSDGNGGLFKQNIDLDHGSGGGLNMLTSGDVNGDGLADIVSGRTSVPTPSGTSDGFEVLFGVYDFTGFFPPVDNLPILNKAKAGRAIPVKFSLNGNQGSTIFAPGYPKSSLISCSSLTQTNIVEETVNAGSSMLSYDPASDTYTYVWKTKKAWSGTCRQLLLKLKDNTTHVANFSFH